MRWGIRYALMEAAGDGGAASGGAAAGAGDGGATGAGAGESAGGAGGAAGAGGADAGAGGASAGSLLATGGADAAANLDWLPEKYRVTGADGAVDLSASAQKLAGGYGELSKRFGEGGAPPATADAYQVNVPDAYKEQFDPAKDELFQAFRGDMHGLGLTQKQFDGVMAKYFEIVPGLLAGTGQLDSETATTALRETWTDPKAFDDNVKLAFRAGSALAKSAGMSFDDLESSGLANNPTFIRLMASIGPEFQEGTSISQGQGGGFASEADIQKLMMSEANTNAKHPDHKATRSRIDAYYARKYGETPVR